MRRAHTLVEGMVALVIATMIIQAVWSSLHLVTVGERVADRDAARALEEARAMELLLRDLRSASGPVESRPGAGADDRCFAFKRWTLRNRRLVEIDVAWTMLGRARIVRTATGEPDQNFQFDARIEDAKKPFDLKIEKVDTAEWRGGKTPATDAPVH